VFLLCAVLGALSNAAVLLLPNSAAINTQLVMLRFATGVCLAGIYPIGMKIASSWFDKGLGAALGFLVGALVIGTGLPHLLRALGAAWPWQYVIIATSLLAFAGGAMIGLWVPDGPHVSKGAAINPRALSVIVQDRRLRASVLGYFGHMWELYAFFALTPMIIAAYLHSGVSRAVSLLSFIVIAAGGVGCAVGGQLARRRGSAPVAAVLLATSGLCALLAPLASSAPWWLFSIWLLLWGFSVSSDSPQFSALTAANAPRELVGSVLTLVNCIGFSITIVSVQWLTTLAVNGSLWQSLPLLALGPALGLLAMRPLLRRERSD
jgi:MFS transporter, DHA1 family, inner membrane transport protein